MFAFFSLLTVLLAFSTNAIQVKPSYGPPPQRLPHREYGVPQQMPFNEYGPPALKYGPPKLNFIGGSGSSSGLYEQVKNHYGAPKPFYGPPYKPQQQYGLPSQQHGAPLKPASTHGPFPQKLPHKPASSYGPPTSQYGPPLPQALPLIQQVAQFKPHHQPASSYGPPPSGPLNIPYGPPPLNYGPPPLPNFNRVPETTIILTGGQNSQSHHQNHQQQAQIQIDASGHSHSIAGSQAPFHTACDGWKPIPAPAGAYIENNHIDTQSGYSQVAQAQAHTSAASSSSFSTTQYNAGTSAGHNSGGHGTTGIGTTTLISGSSPSGNSIIDGLSDEQLVAVALQSSTFDLHNAVQQQDVLPSTGPSEHFNQNGINSIESDVLQVALAPIDDSYSKAPADSYAPASKYPPKFNQQAGTQTSHSGFGLSVPNTNFGQTAPNGRYGPTRPVSDNYGPPPPQHHGNYGPPSGSYGSPPPLPSGKYRPPPPSGNHATAFVHHHGQGGLGIQYGKQTGNLGHYPPHAGTQPNKPVAYRPPVPQGLFEAIGATVQHLDTFGVKPQLQAPTYIPPAANEIPQSGPSNLNIEYGTPQQHFPQNIIAQQLPQQRPAQVFVQAEQQPQDSYQQQQNSHQQQQHSYEQQQNSHQQQQHSYEQQQNSHQQQQHAEYGVPPPPPVQQGLQQAQYLSPPPPVQPQYLPPTGPQQQQFNSGSSYSSSATATFDNSAFATTQYNHGLAHAQHLPSQQEQPRFHDCGHGPNLVDGGGLNYQQQYSTGSTSAIAQNIPLAEQRTHFLSVPASSYGPPPSGGNEIDHVGYASENSQVSTLPDGTNTDGLPGLDGLNVLTAQKSQAIHFSTQETSNDNGLGAAKHEEILSADLLQTILNAVEHPQLQHQSLPANHKAESRSDISTHLNNVDADDENELDVAVQESKHDEANVHLDEENFGETIADVQEINPIVVKEENETKH